MPKNTREWAHRKIEQAKGNMETGLGYIEEVRSRYEDGYPEVAEPLELLQALMLETIALAESIKRSF